MSALRPVVVLFLVAACGKADPCFEPRDVSYQGECVVLEQGWRISKGALPDFGSYCSAPCIDVDAGIGIEGYDDLSDAPLLPKFRRVLSLNLDAHALRDLRGLETVEVERLSLFGTGADDAFESMAGLNVRSMAALTFSSVSGREFLSGSMLEHVASATIDGTGLVSADLSALTFRSLAVRGNRELTALTLPDNAMEALTISDNPKLTELTWDAGIRVKNLRIVSNTSLSSCLLDEFVRSAKPDGGYRTDVFLNGPCP